MSNTLSVLAVVVSTGSALFTWMTARHAGTSADAAKISAQSASTLSANDAARRREERTPKLRGRFQLVNDGPLIRLYIELESAEPLHSLVVVLPDEPPDKGPMFTPDQEGVEPLHPSNTARWDKPLEPGQSAVWQVAASTPGEMVRVWVTCFYAGYGWQDTEEWKVPVDARLPGIRDPFTRLG